MYEKFSVPIPQGKGKITRKKSADGRVYLYLETGRTYLRDKGYTIPKRVCVGKQDLDDASRMFPNEQYCGHFPSESAENTPDVCDTLSLGKIIVRKSPLLS